MVEFSYPCTTATSLCSPSSLLCILLCGGSFWKLLICPALSSSVLLCRLEHRHLLYFTEEKMQKQRAAAPSGGAPKDRWHVTAFCDVVLFSVAGFCQDRGSGSLRTVSFLKVYGVRNLYQPELPVHIANQIALCWPWQREFINCWLLQAGYKVHHIESFQQTSKPQENLSTIHSQEVKSMCLGAPYLPTMQSYLAARTPSYSCHQARNFSLQESLAACPRSVFTEV